MSRSEERPDPRPLTPGPSVKGENLAFATAKFALLLRRFLQRFAAESRGLEPPSLFEECPLRWAADPRLRVQTGTRMLRSPALRRGAAQGSSACERHCPRKTGWRHGSHWQVGSGWGQVSPVSSRPVSRIARRRRPAEIAVRMSRSEERPDPRGPVGGDIRAAAGPVRV